ncbi:polysaccharide biosynthesis protein, partial [Bacillus cereus]|nr:polysaccharide biosynthesis protein [Bacillus cereus]
IEQKIRGSSIVFLSLFLIAHGFDLYTVGAGAMLASIAGGRFGIIVLILYILHDLRSLFFKISARMKCKWKIVKITFWLGVQICGSNLVLIFIPMADSV